MRLMMDHLPATGRNSFTTCEAEQLRMAAMVGRATGAIWCWRIDLMR
jgi:hypothetical protein